MSSLKRDYASFSSVAKSRFRPMASSFGFSQITGIRYLKKRDGFLEGFSLWHAGRGQNEFKIIYGIKIPENSISIEGKDLKSLSKDISGYRSVFYNELINGDGLRAHFSSRTKLHIENSARKAELEFEKQAVPWFNQFSSRQDVETYHLNKTGKYLNGKPSPWVVKS